MNIQQLADLMNMNESSVKSFVKCLQVWTDKGFTIEQAIKKHQDIMSRMAANPDAVVAMVRPDVVKHFYPE